VIIDISTGQPKVFAQRPDPSQAEAKNVTPEQRVTQYKSNWQACRHFKMVFDDKQRTIQCGDCDMWLDPFWAFKEIWDYYDRRVDHRLEQIREHEKRQQEASERRAKRRTQPRKAMIDRRAETAERAAYNEYQAKLLTARAERQRARVARLDDEIRREEVQELNAGATPGGVGVTESAPDRSSSSTPRDEGDRP
jgi:hypothetical protein